MQTACLRQTRHLAGCTPRWVAQPCRAPGLLGRAGVQLLAFCGREERLTHGQVKGKTLGSGLGSFSNQLGGGVVWPHKGLIAPDWSVC